MRRDYQDYDDYRRRGDERRRDYDDRRRQDYDDMRRYGDERYEDDYAYFREHSRRRRGGSGALLVILIIILAGGVVFAGYKLGTILFNYHRDRSAYQTIADNAVTTSTPRPTDKADEDADAAEPFVSEIPIEIDWAYLESQNEDIIGWLYCADTIINYPVVQHTDNEYYLKHGFDGQSNVAGTLFADSTSELGITRGNVIIYGHNMKDGSMFGTLSKYTDESYYEEHPVMYFLTPEQGYRVEFMCDRISESAIVNFPTYFVSVTEQQTYINDITSHAFWVNASAATTDYEMITLATCAYNSNYADPRYLLHGILIPIQ